MLCMYCWRGKTFKALIWRVRLLLRSRTRLLGKARMRSWLWKYVYIGAAAEDQSSFNELSVPLMNRVIKKKK